MRSAVIVSTVRTPSAHARRGTESVVAAMHVAGGMPAARLFGVA